MLLGTVLAATTLAASAGFVHALPEDIPDDERLVVVFGPRPIHAPGALMHPGHMSNIPSISTPTWNQADPSALLFMVDLDWPLDNTRVSRLHWLATGLTLSGAAPPPDGSNTTAVAVNIPDPPVVQYMPPAPPVGDMAHSYAFYLFATPRSFVLPSVYTRLGDSDAFDENGTLIAAESRAPFDVGTFLADCGLDDADLLARNHVRVRNLAGTDPSKTFPPARQATGALEGGVLEPGVEETRRVASSSSGGSSTLRESEIGAWRWAALFVLDGLLFVLV
ncbi:hypothetical protein E8E12_008059 [Didymella heteroderae]|uniref:PEBP-like protein n=1 Tax=Didymella heteroderae TaxID=1769908 RepID=A0A9P5BZU3_9PLEO|nr:hypothetical protein E8E12_008059 [Didymella heteroderae]